MHSLSETSPFDSGISNFNQPPPELLRESPATRDYDYEFAVPTPHALKYSTKGFSVSGETEQRMNLARTSADGGGEYVFREARVGKRERWSSTVKGITRGFRDIFRVRSYAK